MERLDNNAPVTTPAWNCVGNAHILRPNAMRCECGAYEPFMPSVGLRSVNTAWSDGRFALRALEAACSMTPEQMRGVANAIEREHAYCEAQWLRGIANRIENGAEPETNDTVSVRDAAKRAGLSARTLARWVEVGVLPPYTVAQHPSGRGRIGIWPATVERRISRVKAALKAGYGLSVIEKAI